MLIEVIVGKSLQRRWHETLVGLLRSLPDVDVRVRLTDDPRSAGYRRLQRLLRLERSLHRLDIGGLAQGRLEDAPSPSGLGSPPDVTLDLTPSPSTGHWSVRYDGLPGEQAAVDALRAGRFPIVSVIDGSGAERARGRPGSEMPGLLSTALADVGAGTATLLVGAVAGREFAEPDAEAGEARSPRSYSEIAFRRLAGAAIRLAYRIGFRAPHWRVGWRAHGDADALVTGRVSDAGWKDVDDDGYHFYADPFPFEHRGRTYVFVEDFDHRVGKGVISVAPWGPGGPEGEFACALSHEVHLSYPFVLEHDGDIWMIPETSGAKTLELYRAVSFPLNWERHSVLLEGVEISDATPFEHDGRWWLTATVGHGGSLSDALCLWSAPDLRGPWVAHRNNPVLVDIASARPAGRVERRAGRLLRPVQDCRGGYGAALSIAEITRLDDEAFEQRIVSRHASGDGWGGTRLHTLNSGGGIETVDGSRLVPRFRLQRAQNAQSEQAAQPGLSDRSGRRPKFTVAREDDLDLLGDEYAELYANSSASAFQHGVWLDQLYGRLAPARGAERCIVAVRAADDGKLVGVLPLAKRRSGAVRLIEYADLGVSDYAVPVIDRDYASAIRGDTKIPRRIRSALGAFDLLLIERVTETAVPLVALFSGARTRALPYGGHPAPLAADVETWRGTLAPRFARHLEKASKRLRSRGCTLRIATDPAEIDALLELLREFRAARFAQRGGTDLFPVPDYFDFYCAAARAGAGGRGPVTVNVLEVDGAPVAVALDLVERERELYVITGYDVARMRNYSLGLVIVDQIAQAAIGRGTRVLDLTVGDEPYKAGFGARRRPLAQVYVARTPLGLATFVGRVLYRAARRTAKRVLVASGGPRKRVAERVRALTGRMRARGGSQAPGKR